MGSLELKRLTVASRLRTAVFFLGVLALNYTWLRPSPVDVLFLAALLLTFFCRQVINIKSFVFICVALTWLASIYISSVSLTAYPRVVFDMIALTSVVCIAITGCLVTTTWDERQLRTFVNFYVISNMIAAVAGIFGFFTHNPNLTWADRPTGFLDDPDMFGVFLVPGLLSCLFMISQGQRRSLYSACLLILSLAILLSFSRAAIVSALLWGGLYSVYLNRRNLVKASLFALAFLAPLAIVLMLFSFASDDYSKMLAGRFTLAENYDLGHFGRYNRYLLAVPMILDHPFGIGLEQVYNYFPEPIHNVWIASFLYFGWVGGLAWTLLLMLTVQQGWYTWKRYRSEAYLLILVSWLSVVSCSMLHEGERWRFMWLLFGILWGLNVHLRAGGGRFASYDKTGADRRVRVGLDRQLPACRDAPLRS